LAGVLLAFAVSLGVVFVAELGDKSQLMALTFATRYRALPVLVGITVATAAVHLISVAVGYGLGVALPTGWISLVAAVAFLGFGAWTLRGDELTEQDRLKAEQVRGSAVVAASVAFFLAELGDKTMLATITLATQHGWLGVWIGSTLGMVAADALAIAVGRRLGRRLPERTVKLGASVLFFGFGIWLGAEAIVELAGTSDLAAPGTVLDHHSTGWIALGLVGFVIVLRVLGRRVGVASALRSRRRLAPGSPGWWARAMFVASALLGLAAPLLVGIDLIQPVPLLLDPGVVVVGAGFALLGVVLVLAARVQVVSARGEVRDPIRIGGLYTRMRNPGLTGMVVAMAGTLLMVPTLLAVVATVLLVAAVQIQVRAVREPGMARLHGTVYAGYTARTGRFLPRVLPPLHDDPAAGLSGPDRARVG
jgi:putative Ca2+/H+ antiporter (TMEM165/GDT1 family)/protein-S-isoprenylcysteine O-methyltransferase Ste14